MLGQYTIGEFLCNCAYFVYTKLRFPGARLVRLPIYLRGGRSHLSFEPGLTTGYGCRMDLGGEGVSLSIGRNCKINDRVHFVAHERVSIGDDVLMASNIFISDTSHGSLGEGGEGPEVPPDGRKLVTSPVAIGDRVWIGEGARIMPGVTLGNGCVVGANAVVTKSFPAGTVVAGVPARVIKRWDQATERWERV